MIAAILGGLGAGKTALQALFARVAYANGVSVFANYTLTFPHTPLRSIDDLLSISNGLALIDELQLFADAREFAKKSQILVVQWLTLTRHFGLDLCYTTQDFEQVDKRVRGLTDFLIFAEKYDTFFLYTVVATHSRRVVNSFSIKRHPKIFTLYDSHNKDISMLALGSSDLASAMGLSQSNKVVSSSHGVTEPSAKRDGSPSISSISSLDSRPARGRGRSLNDLGGF